MPLVSGDENGFPDLFRIGFGMKDGTDPVTVWVSHEALEDWEPRATDGHMAIFERQRSIIESIASEKYDAKKIQRDGSVLVTSADVDARP